MNNVTLFYPIYIVIFSSIVSTLEILKFTIVDQEAIVVGRFLH